MYQKPLFDPWVQELLHSLALPASESMSEMVASLSENVGFQLDMLMTDDLVREIWAKWNPKQSERINDSKFRQAFRTMLAEGLSMGFSLTRFRGISRTLPDPDEGEKEWMALFEAAIVGKEHCNIRLSLNPAEYKRYQLANQAESDQENSWNALFSKNHNDLFYELGLILPPISVSEDQSLAEPYFRLEWNDLRLPAHRGIKADQVLVDETQERLRLWNIDGESWLNPVNGNEYTVIDKAEREVCKKAGLTTWDDREYIMLKVKSTIRRAAGAFVTQYLIDYYLNQLKPYSPQLHRQVTKQVDKNMLVQIIRGLLKEDISVRNLRLILNSILSAKSSFYTDASKYIAFAHNASRPLFTAYKKSPDRLTVIDYLSHVRTCLKRYISHKYTRGQNTLIVYLMDVDTEGRLKQATALTDSEKSTLIKALRNEIDALPTMTQRPVILTTLDIRHRLRMAIRHDFPHLAVLCYKELSPDLNIQAIAIIEPDLYPHDDSFDPLIEALPLFSELKAYQSGLLAYEEDRLDEAIMAFQQVIRLNPNHVEAYNYLGSVFFLNERPDEAIRTLHRALELDSKHTESSLNLGLVYKETGRTNEAINMLRRYLELVRDDDSTAIYVRELIQELESPTFTLVDEFVARYDYGNDNYDMNFSIETPQMEFLGECGFGTSQTLDKGTPQQVTAFDLWLFDKDDLRAPTKVLLSDYAFLDDQICAILMQKGKLFRAIEGSTIELETKSLRLRAHLREVIYADNDRSYFERVVIDLTALQKKKG